MSSSTIGGNIIHDGSVSIQSLQPATLAMKASYNISDFTVDAHVMIEALPAGVRVVIMDFFVILKTLFDFNKAL